MCFRSSLNACRSSSPAKYLLVRAHSVIVATTRPTSCLMLRSRSGVPICPRKYFETTMLVACCDQNFGISTSRCSKTTSPRSLPMTAARSSHSISSNGSTPACVKNRGNVSPGAGAIAFAQDQTPNMSLGGSFVKRVTTTYGAFVLGHSQDVERVAGGEAVFRPPPVVHRQGWVAEFFLP